VGPGKQEGGGAKKIKKSASFLFEVSCSQRQKTRRGIKGKDPAAAGIERFFSLNMSLDLLFRGWLYTHMLNMATIPFFHRAVEPDSLIAVL